MARIYPDAIIAVQQEAWFSLPEASDVRSGVVYGDGETGTLQLPTLPDVADVRSGTTYGYNSALTGTMNTATPGTYPATGNVRGGIVYGPTASPMTGTMPTLTFALPVGSLDSWS
jgi:hypothetical protein